MLKAVQPQSGLCCSSVWPPWHQWYKQLTNICCSKIKSELSDNFPCVENFLVPNSTLCFLLYHKTIHICFAWPEQREW